MTQNSNSKEDQEIDQIMSEIQELRAAIAQPESSPEGESGDTMTQNVQAAEIPTDPEVVEAEAKKEEPKGLLDMAIEADQQSEQASGEEEETFSEDELEEIDEDELAELMDNAPGSKISAVPTSAGDATSGGSVSMTLSGNMTLRLKYEFNGQEVSVGFKDQFLEVELTDGTQFKIPVRAPVASKTKLKAVS